MRFYEETEIHYDKESCCMKNGKNLQDMQTKKILAKSHELQQSRKLDTDWGTEDEDILESSSTFKYKYITTFVICKAYALLLSDVGLWIDPHSTKLLQLVIKISPNCNYLIPKCIYVWLSKLDKNNPTYRSESDPFVLKSDLFFIEGRLINS